MRGEADRRRPAAKPAAGAGCRSLASLSIGKNESHRRRSRSAEGRRRMEVDSPASGGEGRSSKNGKVALA